MAIIGVNIRSSQLIMLISAFLIALNNYKYFSGVVDAFPLTENYLFVISVGKHDYKHCTDKY